MSIRGRKLGFLIVTGVSAVVGMWLLCYGWYWLHPETKALACMMSGFFIMREVRSNLEEYERENG